MTRTSARLLLWTPRLLGILVSLFIGMFALDAFSEGRPFLEALGAFAVHLVPALVLLGVVAAAWRWEWIGGVAFVGLALYYAWLVAPRGRYDWILVISGPLLVAGVAFFWSWRHHGALRTAK
jgi:hypothetical protein